MREDAGIELQEPVAPPTRGGEDGGGGRSLSGDAGIELQGGIQDEENSTHEGAGSGRSGVIEQLIRQHMTD
jgi:hypothetical protein